MPMALHSLRLTQPRPAARGVAQRAQRRSAVRVIASKGNGANGSSPVPLKHVDGYKKSDRQFRSREALNFDPTLSLEVEVTDKALKKAARKAVKNYKYEVLLEELQHELVVMQEYIKAKGLKIVVLFEGRDAAGKGGAIQRITDAMSPRITRVVALGAPTDKEKSEWYFQKYVKHLPGAGEMVLFDRSWYNRAGVERVMGFCSDAQYEEFMRSVPLFEEMLVNSGTILIKLWFDVSDAEQEARFQARLGRSWKRWKLSPMDLFARSKWFEYAKARDEMFARTSGAVPWDIVPSDDKKVARLNALTHILASIDYERIDWDDITLPPREENNGYEAPALDEATVRTVPPVYKADDLACEGEACDVVFGELLHAEKKNTHKA